MVVRTNERDQFLLLVDEHVKTKTQLLTEAEQVCTSLEEGGGERRQGEGREEEGREGATLAFRYATGCAVFVIAVYIINQI